MSSFANAIAARTEQEAQLYLEVRGLHVTHAERRVEAERTWLDVTAQDANNAQGQAYHYTFELLEPEGEGLGSGAGSCLEATDLWDYAQTRARSIFATPPPLSDLHFESLRRVLTIARTALAMYEAQHALPTVRSQQARDALAARPLDYQRDQVAGTIGTWQASFDRAAAARASATAAERSTQEQMAIEEYYLADHTTYQSTNNRPGLAHLLIQRGRAYESVAALELAAADYERALELFRALRDLQGEAAALTDLGELSTKRGELQVAQTHYDRALSSYIALGGDPGGEADALWGRGRLWLLGRDPDASAADLNLALEHYYNIGSKHAAATALFDRARLRAHRGVDMDGADWDFTVSAQMFGELGDARQADVVSAAKRDAARRRGKRD